MKIIWSLVFGLWSLVATAQIANTQLAERTYAVDTVKGCALVIMDIVADMGDGTERTQFRVVTLPVYRTRQQTDAVTVNDPTGQVRAYITHYYQRDWSQLQKDDVLIFTKRDWK